MPSWVQGARGSFTSSPLHLPRCVEWAVSGKEKKGGVLALAAQATGRRTQLSSVPGVGVLAPHGLAHLRDARAHVKDAELEAGVGQDAIDDHALLVRLEPVCWGTCGQKSGEGKKGWVGSTCRESTYSLMLKTATVMASSAKKKMLEPRMLRGRQRRHHQRGGYVVDGLDCAVFLG